MRFKILILIVLAQATLSIQAQTIPYEKLDSISAEISKMQIEANGLTFNDGNTDYEISFPEENFKVYYHNQLATTAIYKKQDGKELLALTENIDFSKATGYVNSVANNNIVSLRVYFPKGYLKTQYYDNGVLVNTIYEDHLDFFRINKEVDKGLSYYLFDLITSIQIAKGLVTEAEISNQKSDIDLMSSISDAQNFISKYPASPHNLQLKAIIKQLEEEEIEKIKKGEEDFMKYVYSKYYEIGLTLEEAKIKYPEYFNKYKRYQYESPKSNPYQYQEIPTIDKAYLSKSNQTGTILFQKNGKIIGYRETIQIVTGDDAAYSKGNEALSELKSNLTAMFLFNPKTETFSVIENGFHETYYTYSWEKNGKKISIEYRSYPSAGYKGYYGNITEIYISQYDN